MSRKKYFLGKSVIGLREKEKAKRANLNLLKFKN